MAQELSARRWKVLFGCGGRTRGPIDVAAGDVEREPAARIAVRLQQLKAIGGESAWVFACELLGWRRFANRRELAVALASRASAGTEVRRT
jgi:hypothetical protein